MWVENNKTLKGHFADEFQIIRAIKWLWIIYLLKCPFCTLPFLPTFYFRSSWAMGNAQLPMGIDCIDHWRFRPFAPSLPGLAGHHNKSCSKTVFAESFITQVSEFCPNNRFFSFIQSMQKNLLGTGHVGLCLFMFVRPGAKLNMKQRQYSGLPCLWVLCILGNNLKQVEKKIFETTTKCVTPTSYESAPGLKWGVTRLRKKANANAAIEASEGASRQHRGQGQFWPRYICGLEYIWQTSHTKFSHVQMYSMPGQG